jgi:acetyl-CoA synthetase
MAMRPFFGIVPAILDEKTGLHLEPKNSQGVLCIKQTWPGMARTIYGDHERFLNTYFKPYPGYYFSGDGAQTDEDGYFQITGRVDDVMNVSGHRIGTAEIEDALVKITKSSHIYESIFFNSIILIHIIRMSMLMWQSQRL